MGPLKFLLRFSKPKEPFPRENTGIRALEAYLVLKGPGANVHLYVIPKAINPREFTRGCGLEFYF